MSSLKDLEKQLGYPFQNRELLKRALTHRSAVGKTNNERLEFLGDALLGHIIAEVLYTRHPNAREGELSRMRSSLVRGEQLGKIGKNLNLGTYLSLGVGEQKSGGHERQSILANAVEALFGAIYIDSGFEACRKVVIKIYGEQLNVLPDVISEKDAKTNLQEWLQAHKLPLPTYESTATGEAHAQTFHVTCTVEGLPYKTEGESSNRRKAEQAAAKAFMELIDERKQ